MEYLKTKYKQLCEEYLRLFCEKHELSNDGWVADKHGEVAMCSDFFIDFSVITHDIDNDIEVGKWEEYEDYASQASELGLIVPNYPSFLKGCQRTDKKTLENLWKLKNDFEEILKEENGKFK